MTIQEDRSLQEALDLVDRLMPLAKRARVNWASLESAGHPLPLRMDRSSVGAAIDMLCQMRTGAGDYLSALLAKHCKALSSEMVRRLGGIPEEAPSFKAEQGAAGAIVNAAHCIGVYNGYTAAVDYLSDLTDRAATYVYNALLKSRLGSEWASRFGGAT